MVTGAVLVVDDDPLVRFGLISSIEDAGYRVVEAHDATQAIAVLERRDVFAVVTDVHMPGAQDGLGLARTVADRWPGIQIVVISGRLNLDRKDLPERARFFAKPFDSDELVAALRSFHA